VLTCRDAFSGPSRKVPAALIRSTVLLLARCTDTAH
jgi:hypothetical protein